MSLAIGHWEADGAIVYIPIGFVPDYFYMIDMVTDGESIHYEWFREMADVNASYGGGLTEDDDGVNAWVATASGITTYDTGAEGPTINEWTTARSTAATARTATVPGTFIKPTTSGTDTDGLTADRSAIFECITAGTGSATEPSWNMTIGGSTTDGTTIWQAVNQATYRSGYQGVTISASIQTDGQECFFRAEQANVGMDYEDVDGWAGGVENA